MIADVEEDVRMEVSDKLKMLELQIVEKEEIIREKDNILNRLEANVKVSQPPAEKDALVVNQMEQHLEGEGERSDIDSDHPKLLRLRSVQGDISSILIIIGNRGPS